MSEQVTIFLFFRWTRRQCDKKLAGLFMYTASWMMDITDRQYSTAGCSVRSWILVTVGVKFCRFSGFLSPPKKKHASTGYADAHTCVHGICSGSAAILTRMIKWIEQRWRFFFNLFIEMDSFKRFLSDRRTLPIQIVLKPFACLNPGFQKFLPAKSSRPTSWDFK